MKTIGRWRRLLTAGLGLALCGLTGCQTWMGGMTLPSGEYLRHPPQYFIPSPTFPLHRELATMQLQAGALPAGIRPEILPPAPIVPPAVPPPVPPMMP